MAVYAVSDIHGHYDLFLEGLSEINFSDSDFLWCLGDAIDRGTDGIKILNHIMSSENIDLIIGNHELMMLNSVSEDGSPACNGRDAPYWLEANGGKATFAQYKLLQKEERARLLEWMKNRFVVKTISVAGNEYCLTHSFYDEKCEGKRYHELTYDEVWNITWSSIWREDYYSHAMDIYPRYDFTFVIGHVPVQRVRRWQMQGEEWNVAKGLYHENVINIDGGCAMGDNSEVNNGLIFFRLDDREEFCVPMKKGMD